MLSGDIVYRDAFIAGLEPDPDITVSEWADEYRRLSPKHAAEAGPWRTDRTPYLRAIMDELSPNCPTQRIVFMKASQIGGSECGFNWLGYIVHMAPAPTMFVAPNDQLAEAISKERIMPMILETPVLKERISPARERDSGNTILVKEFQGGQLVMTGANSGPGLRSRPIRNLFCTEISAYPADVGKEGDPVSLAEKRTQTFFRRKIYLESTPGIKDACRIEAEYLNSDQRRFFLPCPDCGHMQYLKWSNIKWENDDPKTACYACEQCGVLIEERHKTDMLSKGEWRATAPGDGKSVGFHISSLYSPLGWKSWSEIVEEFLKARKDAPLLKAWVNSVLGETWEEAYSAKVGASELAQRAEIYKAAPAGVLIVTAGFDVQDNRIACLIEGWGREEESWILSYQEIFGDPARPEVWKQVDEILLSKIEHESGMLIPIHAAAIDSGGHFTSEVYQYTRERKSRGIIAVRGASQKAKPILTKPTKVDINMKGQSLKRGGEVWLVGTDTAKSTIYGRLKHNQPGPGYTHFHSELGPDFYEQLTAEKQEIRYVKGFPTYEWKKKDGQRNEVLDCKVYSLAALHFLYSRFNRKTIWNQFERRLKESPEKRVEVAEPLPKPRSTNIMKPMRKGWVNNY